MHQLCDLDSLHTLSKVILQLVSNILLMLMYLKCLSVCACLGHTSDNIGGKEQEYYVGHIIIQMFQSWLSFLVGVFINLCLFILD